jgi:hypothetical protein
MPQRGRSDRALPGFISMLWVVVPMGMPEEMALHYRV